MKYPQKQYDVLIDCLKQFAPLMNIDVINVHALHYIVYQQFSEGQTHNHLYCTVNGLKRAYQLTELEKTDSRKLIEIKFDFKLYPDGCNDSHIETAMKRVIKELTKILI